jgi:uncharacterized MAPEG superfamily protein
MDMTTAYWCVLIIISLPYVWVLMARLPGFSLQNNLMPRPVAEHFTGIKQRIYWAHQNALEAVAPFAAAVIIAQQLHAPQMTVDNLAVFFVVIRIAHALAYMANQGVLRTLIFLAGMSCVVSLFVVSV